MATLKFDSARFSLSAPTLAQCPAEVTAEVAFVGRSNAGKSSALNALTRNAKLARTSKTPGRTQLINYFALSDGHSSLVDLPGYGYAKVNPQMKQDWDRNIGEYLAERQSLVGLVLLMDIRHPLTAFDQSMIAWSIKVEMPMRVLLTKSDKLKKSPAQQTLMKVSHELTSQANWLSVQLFSSLKKTGITQLEDWLNTCFATATTD